METEIDAFSVQYDEESTDALIRKSSKISSLIRNFEVVENTVENGNGNCSGEEVKNGIMKDAEPFEITSVEEIFSPENKELVEGGSNGHFLIMNSSNGSAVTAMPAKSTEPEKTQPNAKSEWSVYFEENEGSESREFLDKEGEAIDYENKDAELVKDGKVIKTMAKKTMTEVNENQSSVSETMMLNLLDGFVGAQDDTRPTDHCTRTLENSTSTGKVEEIVRVLKEQQTHDLLCPACGSCITKRVILRKRKRTSTVSVNRLIQELDDDAQSVLSEDNEQITEDHNDQPDISHADTDENEAYGCLTCFTIFFRRDEKKESFYCLPFWNTWRESSKKEPTRPAEFTNSLSHQAKETHGVATQSTSSKTFVTATKALTVSSSMENGGSQNTTYTLTEATHTLTEATHITQYVNESDKSSELKEQFPPAQNTEDQLTKLHLDDSAISHAKQELEHAKTETSNGDERIHEDSATHDQESNIFSAVRQDEELQQDTTVQKDGSYKNDYIGSCIPVSNQSIWSIWPFKERINDQLQEPLLPGKNVEENLSAARNGSVPHGILQSDELPTRSQSQGDKESEATLPLISTVVKSSHLLDKQDLAPLHSESTENSTDVTVSPVQTVVEIGPIDDPRPSDVATAVSDLARSTSAQLPATKIVTEWDIVKSIVYGGLTVSLTSLGVVSSAAGGEAKTLTVIVMGLANVVAGLFVILNNVLDLDHYHQDQFIDTVGHSFWFNGSVAIVSYLIFGSLAPITYAFSFRKSDDILHKFIATSAVSLVCIILLALGKARVSRKSYIRTVIVYIVTGFCSAVAGFFAGEYIKKLLEKWGL